MHAQQHDSTVRDNTHLDSTRRLLHGFPRAFYECNSGKGGEGLVQLRCHSDSDMTGKDCAGASPAPLICSADPRQSRRDFPPKPSYPPAEQKSPPILTRRYCRDAFHSETKDSRGRRDGRGESLWSILSHTHARPYKFLFSYMLSDGDRGKIKTSSSHGR